jgi:hypothetical protein
MMVGLFGLGWLAMVLMIGLPILGVVLLLLAAAGFFQNRSLNVVPIKNQEPLNRTLDNTSIGAPVTGRYCAHCGAGLQADWTHCPQCGAAV